MQEFIEPRMEIYELYAANFGVIANRGNDNTNALNKVISYAIDHQSLDIILPGGEIGFSGPLIFPDKACTLKIRGQGRPKGFLGQVDGDPIDAQGTQLTFTGTGDAIFWELTGQNKRIYLTVENLSLRGGGVNPSQNGIHLKAANETVAFLVCYRDISVFGCHGSGIFHEGNIFESQLFNVRSTGNGECGFRAIRSGAALPGETRIFASTFDGNRVGVDISGGGHWSYHGLTCSYNQDAGLIASGIKLEGIDLQLEANGDMFGSQGLFQLHNALFGGVSISAVSNSLGRGLNFVKSSNCRIMNFGSNSSITASGYSDIFLDDQCFCFSIDQYVPDDSKNRVLLNGGGHSFSNGQMWHSAQGRSQTVILQSRTKGLVIDAKTSNSFSIIVSRSAITIPAPDTAGLDVRGMEIDIILSNQYAGPATVGWSPAYVFSGPEPKAMHPKGKIVLGFVFDGGSHVWLEKTRSQWDC